VPGKRRIDRMAESEFDYGGLHHLALVKANGEPITGA
jgi:hypothetical protein